jgi:hypothetical protein
MEISLKMISKLVILVLAIGSYLVGITQSVENFQSYPQSYPPNDGQYTFTITTLVLQQSLVALL